MKFNIPLETETLIRVEKWSRRHDALEVFEFKNVVLDVGWDALLVKAMNGYGAAPEYLFLGTGTSEPAKTDTGLESISGTLPGKQYTAGPSSTNMSMVLNLDVEHYHQFDAEFAYGEGEAEGTWTELGLAYDSSYTEPYNRALFRDDQGNAISLTVLSDEYLTVKIKLRVTFPASETTGTFNANGVSSGYTVRPRLGYLDNNNPYWTANVWYSGLARYGGHFNYPYYELQDFITNNIDPNTGTTSPTLQIDPQATAVTNDTVDGMLLSSRSQSSTFGNSVMLMVHFDSTMARKEDERLTGSISVQYSRAP